MTGIFQLLLAGKKDITTFLYGWGNNSNGQLGLNDIVARSSPTQVGTLSNWADVKMGGGVTIAIKTDGTLWGWGRNDSGQVGDNTTVDKSSPVQIGALTNWSKIGKINYKQCAAIKTDGTLWTWGLNSFGSLGLGTGTGTNKSSPTQVGALTNWSSISCGYQMAAIKTDGTLWAWGINQFDGAVGDNTVIDRSSPVQIGAGTNWSKVNVNGRSCFAIKTDGTLWTWGSNNNGQLGLNLGGAGNNKSSPTQVGALTNWSQTGSGYYSSFAVKTDGTLWAWGRNNYGQLAQNDTVNRSSPVQIGALTNWSIPDGGNTFGLCIKTDDTLWAWGRGVWGQLGQGNITYISSPVQVGLLPWSKAVGSANSTMGITK